MIEFARPRSPIAAGAEQAGLQAGDVLIQLDDTRLADLRAFSNFLKTLAPVQAVSAVVIRDGEEVTMTVTVVAR